MTCLPPVDPVTASTHRGPLGPRSLRPCCRATSPMPARTAFASPVLPSNVSNARRPRFTRGRRAVSCHIGATLFRDLRKRIYRRRGGIYLARNLCRYLARNLCRLALMPLPWRKGSGAAGGGACFATAAAPRIRRDRGRGRSWSRRLPRSRLSIVLLRTQGGAVIGVSGGRRQARLGVNDTPRSYRCHPFSRPAETVLSTPRWHLYGTKPTPAGVDDDAGWGRAVHRRGGARRGGEGNRRVGPCLATAARA